MGDAADDMYEHAMRESEKILCVKHQHYYHPQWGCELCEDDLPLIGYHRKPKPKPYTKSAFRRLPLDK